MKRKLASTIAGLSGSYPASASGADVVPTEIALPRTFTESGAAAPAGVSGQIRLLEMEKP